MNPREGNPGRQRLEFLDVLGLSSHCTREDILEARKQRRRKAGEYGRGGVELQRIDEAARQALQWFHAKNQPAPEIRPPSPPRPTPPEARQKTARTPPAPRAGAGRVPVKPSPSPVAAPRRATPSPRKQAPASGGKSVGGHILAHSAIHVIPMIFKLSLLGAGGYGAKKAYDHYTAPSPVQTQRPWDPPPQGPSQAPVGGVTPNFYKPPTPPAPPTGRPTVYRPSGGGYSPPSSGGGRSGGYSPPSSGGGRR